MAKTVRSQPQRRELLGLPCKTVDRSPGRYNDKLAPSHFHDARSETAHSKQRERSTPEHRTRRDHDRKQTNVCTWRALVAASVSVLPPFAAFFAWRRALRTNGESPRHSTDGMRGHECTVEHGRLGHIGGLLLSHLLRLLLRLAPSTASTPHWLRRSTARRITNS